jgi:tRNA modification GTPase
VAQVKRLTPAGRGAVAVVAFVGDPRVIDAPPPLFRAASGKDVADLPLARVAFGQWGTQTTEDVVVCRTGPEHVEICCHGGDAAGTRILHDLEGRGCNICDGFVAASNSAEPLVDRECREVLSRATTLRTADILLQQQSGLLRESFEQFLGSAFADPVAAASSRRNERPSAVGSRAEKGLPAAGIRRHGVELVDALLRWADFGLHLTEPWQVVLCGRPNVGKSSLINALLGYARSIVLDLPGTTRDVVRAETAFDGWPIVLSDTAGLRDDVDELETAGIERARRQITAADLKVVLIDVSAAPQEDDRRLLAAWPDALVVAHKCDLPCVWPDEPPLGALSVSSLTGAGVDQLAAEIVRRLAPRVPPPMTPLPITRRQVEVLREIRELIDGGAQAADISRRAATLVSG